MISPDTTTDYLVTAHYKQCPVVSKQVKLMVEPVPDVFIGPDTFKCQWDQLFLYASVKPAGYDFYSYRWNTNNYISSANKAGIVFNGPEDTTLYLTVVTPFGCADTDDIHITVHSGNFGTVSPADTGICPGSSVNLQTKGGASVTWMPSLYLDDTNSYTPISFPVAGIRYTGYVTDQYGCLDTVYSNIDVYPAAVLYLEESATLYAGESITLNPEGNCLYFTWFPPYGLSNPHSANPTAAPEVDTRYVVFGKTESGCTIVDSIDVLVKTEPIIEMPNAFTPGAVPNDLLKIIHKGTATLRYFRVFNRYGNKLFETSDMEVGWDGSYNEVPQPMGVYIYTIEADTKKGKRIMLQGNTTLIR